MTKLNLLACIANLVEMLEEYGANIDTIKRILEYHKFPKEMLADWFGDYETEEK